MEEVAGAELLEDGGCSRAGTDRLEHGVSTAAEVLALALVWKRVVAEHVRHHTRLVDYG